MFEYFVGILYGFALLSDYFVMFFCANFTMYLGTLCLAGVVYLRRRFSDGSGDGIVVVEGWQAVEL